MERVRYLFIVDIMSRMIVFISMALVFLWIYLNMPEFFSTHINTVSETRLAGLMAGMLAFLFVIYVLCYQWRHTTLEMFVEKYRRGEMDDVEIDVVWGQLMKVTARQQGYQLRIRGCGRKIFTQNYYMPETAHIDLLEVLRVGDNLKLEIGQDADAELKRSLLDYLLRKTKGNVYNKFVRVETIGPRIVSIAEISTD